jgi:WD40 repeat protein
MLSSVSAYHFWVGVPMVVPVDVIVGHMDSVWSVSISPDGKHVVSGSEDKTV